MRTNLPNKLIAATLLVLVAGCGAPPVERQPIETRRPNLDVLTIAHRGAEKFAPENTLPGIEKAIELGYDYVELDIRYTSDRVPVLMHDADVERTTDGTGLVGDMSFDEIRKLDAGSWFSAEFAGTKVPLLEEALALMQDKICVYWDTKEFPDEYTLSLFERYGFGRECMLISFGGMGYGTARPEIPEWLVDHWPEAPLVPPAKESGDVQKVLDDFPNARAVVVLRWHVKEDLIDTAHASGLLVLSSTMNKSDTPESYERMAALGLDILMLSNMDLYRNWYRNPEKDAVSAQ